MIQQLVSNLDIYMFDTILRKENPPFPQIYNKRDWDVFQFVLGNNVKKLLERNDLSILVGKVCETLYIKLHPDLFYLIASGVIYEWCDDLKMVTVEGVTLVYTLDGELLNFKG